MKKQSLITILLTVFMSMAGAKAFAYDIEAVNKEGVTIYYVWANNGTELSVSSSFFNEYIGEVVIPESVVYYGNTYPVTSIGDYAFNYCSKLTSVTIPNSVTSIGQEAFCGCDGLTSVTIGNSVKTIGIDAFCGCDGLTSIIIPEGVTSIGNGAFYHCSSLTSVTIPNSVNSIGSLTFDDTPWFDNQPDGLVYAGKIAYKYKGSMPENTTIVLEDGTLEIAGWAFAGCSNLVSVIIPQSVMSIGDNAFHLCKGLTSVLIPNSIIYIDELAFSDCKDLTTIKSEIVNPQSIASMLPEDMYSKTTLIVPKGTKSKYLATQGWNSFKNIVEVGDGGLINLVYNVDGINYLIGENNTAIVTSKENKYRGNIMIPSQVTINGIKYGVPSIGENAFYFCNDLMSVVIGNGVISIDENAFRGSYPQKMIWLSNTPPSGYTNVLGKINYVSNDDFSINNKVVYPFLSSYFVVDGIIYVPVSPSDRTCDVIDCTYDNSMTSINIGETVINKGIALNVKNINSYAFYGNKNIKEVKVSSNGDIGDQAFYGCTNIKEVNVKTSGNIGNLAFYGCSNIISASISNKGSIGSNVFSSCTALENVELGKDVTSIGGYTFSNCTKLQNIVIPDAVTSIGSYAFQNCSAMTFAKIGSGVETIHDYAFSGCSSLEQIQLGSKVKQISPYAFSGCTALPYVYIPKAVTTIDNYAFKDCSSLKKLIIADSKRSLSLGSNGSDPLFSSCPLDSVYIGRDISYATSSSSGYSPFYRNTSLRAVRITNRETEISENEFYGCTNLQRVRIGNGVTKIGNWAFSGCSSLKFFSFGSTVKEIGQNAFSDCTSVVEIISKAANPPTCETQALDDINKWECKLYVPNGCKATYQGANQWKDFFFVEEGSGTVSPDGNEDTIAGDANCDGEIDESDVNAIANHILSNETAGFSVKNADVNEDGHVDVADIVIVNNIIDFESDPDAEDPVDPSTGNTLSDGISASFVSGAFIKINDQILSGSKFGVKFRNGTGQTVVITKMQLNDAGTGAEGNNLLTEQVVVKAGEEVSYTITVGVNGIYKPVISFTYRYNYYTYQTEGYWFDYPQNNSGGGTEPVDHSNDYLVTDKMSVSFTAGALIKINNMIMSGSKFGVKFNNNSNKTVTLTKMQLNDAETGAEGNNLLTEQVVVPAGGEVSYDNIAVGANGIYRPVICFTYQYNNTAYQVKGEWKE